jgi:hypothetical protein
VKTELLEMHSKYVSRRMTKIEWLIWVHIGCAAEDFARAGTPPQSVFRIYDKGRNAFQAEQLKPDVTKKGRIFRAELQKMRQKRILTSHSKRVTRQKIVQRINR